MTKKININELPKLLISEEELIYLLKTYINKDTIIFTDRFNFNSLSKLGNTVLITSCNNDIIQNIKNDFRFSSIVAIGGCTVLDIGRACAANVELFCFPTILSTTCISNNLSKINFKNGSKLIKTYPPKEVIISIPSLLTALPDEIVKWTQSGFGDLFSNISASIDIQYLKNELSLHKVRENVPEVFEALEWVINKGFNGYDKECMIRLSNYLHNASLDVILRDNTDLTSGSEHILYNKIFENQNTINIINATHGQIVGVGALITFKVFAEYTNNTKLFSDFKLAYQKLKLPTTYEELKKIGIQRQYLIQRLKEIPNENSILGSYFSNNDFDIIDDIFV